MMTGIDQAFLAAVLAQIDLASTPTYEALAQALRAAFPGRHISVCGENDIPPRLKPAAENADALIYFVASGEHCLSLTNDPAAASGIVVALRSEE
ncbi:hypothetical protein GWK36_11855 [Caldichromatium japonicum]|uniref:DUF6129 domain-containing protein n=1 Tax=Caldichromatium japonicum TaxID=2699430 RepID=A0A6G7VF88_9GAMM|nr:DUF6129 family protein [Caldichromatium japonicum]QIK38560.1 hypothetical protein GWK36_11855 [Caldichromatium japonicum]